MSDPNSSPQEVEAPEQAPEETPESSSLEPGQSEPEEAQSPDAEAAGEGEGEAPEGEEATEEQPAKEAGRQPRKGGYVRQIERLQRQLETALNALNGRAPAAQPQEPQKPLTPEAQQAADVEAWLDQKVERRLAQERAAEAARRHQAELERDLEAARARHEDFDDVIRDVAHVPVPAYVNEAILTAEHKAEIMYSLAKNPAELARISALPPLIAAREIGRLEAKFASGAAPQTPRASVRPPAPPSKVVGSVKPSTRSLEDLPVSEYKAAMRSRGGRR